MVEKEKYRSEQMTSCKTLATCEPLTGQRCSVCLAYLGRWPGTVLAPAISYGESFSLLLPQEYRILGVYSESIHKLVRGDF